LLVPEPLRDRPWQAFTFTVNRDCLATSKISLFQDWPQRPLGTGVGITYTISLKDIYLIGTEKNEQVPALKQSER